MTSRNTAASNAARSIATSDTASALTISRKDIRKRIERAEEWKTFRRDFLYSQQHLAHALDCSRRTVTAIENAEVICPHYALLRRFRTLKLKHEDLRDAAGGRRYRWDEEAA